MERASRDRPDFWPMFLGALLLLAQVIAIAQARWVPERFFCWAPFDSCGVYTTRVWLGDRELSRAEVQARYRYPAEGMEPRSMHNLFAIIRRYETSRGRTDGARVEVHHSINGRAKEPWRWPPQ